MTKNELIEKMLGNPLQFDNNDFQAFVESYKQSNNKYNLQEAFSDLRSCVKRIYDMNEEQLRETSNANTGRIGKLNKRSTRIRQENYYKKVAKQKQNKTYKRIYAEGDSWFLFPIFVKDIIDWLEEKDEYLIYSDAYGGDWITNIIYEGQYIEGLTIHSPDIFLISGGGNDLVGNNRMAVMVTNSGTEPVKYTKEELSGEFGIELAEKLFEAQKYVKKEFYSFILTMKAQYTILFKGIYQNTDKYKNLISITQGYAYPYPKNGVNLSLSLQPIVNWFLDSGQWLFRPLMIKGIIDKDLQRNIIMFFIYEFNRMFMEIANNPDFPNVYHIDCRGIPKSEKDWYDELHLKSGAYKSVASLYRLVIDCGDRNTLPKVIC